MNSESKWLSSIVVGLVFSGLITIATVAILRPAVDIQQFATTVATFLAPTILLFIQTFKLFQNGAATNRLEVKVDGNIDSLVKQHTLAASLAGELSAVRTAAELAAKTAADTAIALAAKKEVQ